MVESESDSIKYYLSQGTFVPNPKLRDNPHSLIQSTASNNSYLTFALYVSKLFLICSLTLSFHSWLSYVIYH